MQHIIQEAIQFAETSKMFDRIKAIYDKVPSCEGCISCKACCSESVNVTFPEFLWILKRYFPEYRDLTNIAPELSRRILKFYIFELSIPQKCPFLDQRGLCEIYEARPLACRIYGTRDRHTYEANYAQILRQNVKTARELQRAYDAMPPVHVIAQSIPFCEHVTPQRYFEEEEIQALYDALINLEGQLYFENLMPDYAFNGNLVGHFINTSFEDTQNQLGLINEIRIESMKRLGMR